MTTPTVYVGNKRTVRVRAGTSNQGGAAGWQYNQAGMAYNATGVLYNGDPRGADRVVYVAPKPNVTVRG